MNAGPLPPFSPPVLDTDVANGRLDVLLLRLSWYLRSFSPGFRKTYSDCLFSVLDSYATFPTFQAAFF